MAGAGASKGNLAGLVVGDNPGHKLAQARRLGVRTPAEEEFVRMLT
jgi:NAD-dependent DNA ligase